VVLDEVDRATILNSAPLPGTQVFVKVKGSKSRRIYLNGNALHDVKTPYQLDPEVQPETVKAANNF
jgi:hypothetical protein